MRFTTLLVICAVAISAGCTASVTPPTSSSTSAPVAAVPSAPDTTVTMAKYNQVTTGMSQSKVEEILGAGQEMSRVELPGAPVTVVYMWQNPDGSNMNVTFQADAVVTKAQFGLK